MKIERKTHITSHSIRFAITYIGPHKTDEEGNKVRSIHSLVKEVRIKLFTSIYPPVSG